jgi:hypothetical protein
MGEGTDEIEGWLLSDIKKKFRKFIRGGAEAVHSGIELGLDEGASFGSGGGANEFASFGEGGEGDGEAVLEGAGEFGGEGRAEKENGLADSCATELDAFGRKGDAELFASCLGEGPSDGDKTVTVGVIFNDGENLGFGRERTTYRAEVVAQGRKGNLAPGADVTRNFHRMRIRGGRRG